MEKMNKDPQVAHSCILQNLSFIHLSLGYSMLFYLLRSYCGDPGLDLISPFGWEFWTQNTCATTNVAGQHWDKWTSYESQTAAGNPVGNSVSSSSVSSCWWSSSLCLLVFLNCFSVHLRTSTSPVTVPGGLWWSCRIFMFFSCVSGSGW